jgi:uncharacterized protein involved in oxidation of intracellular sulfur
MSRHLFILSDPPCGTERGDDGLRLAGATARREGAEVRVFLMGEPAACAKGGQTTPHGYDNPERMLKGVTEAGLVEGCRRSPLDELTDWTLWAGRALVF